MYINKLIDGKEDGFKETNDEKLQTADFSENCAICDENSCGSEFCGGQSR